MLFRRPTTSAGLRSATFSPSIFQMRSPTLSVPSRSASDPLAMFRMKMPSRPILFARLSPETDSGRTCFERGRDILKSHTNRALQRLVKHCAYGLLRVVSILRLRLGGFSFQPKLHNVSTSAQPLRNFLMIEAIQRLAVYLDRKRNKTLIVPRIPLR